MNTQHKHLSNWTFGAWELGCSRALLRSSGRRFSSRGRAIVASRTPQLTLELPTGTPRFPPDIWFLSRSSSSPHRRRWPGDIPPLGRARRRRRSGSRRLLLEGASRHDVFVFGALLSLHESLSYGLHGITKEAGGKLQERSAAPYGRPPWGKPGLARGASEGQTIIPWPYPRPGPLASSPSTRSPSPCADPW